MKHRRIGEELFCVLFIVIYNAKLQKIGYEQKFRNIFEFTWKIYLLLPFSFFILMFLDQSMPAFSFYNLFEASTERHHMFDNIFSLFFLIMQCLTVAIIYGQLVLVFLRPTLCKCQNPTSYSVSAKDHNFRLLSGSDP